MFVYIAELKNQTFYCGITNNLNRRIKEHKSKGKGYVQKIGFKRLVWAMEVSDRRTARQHEKRIKEKGVKKFYLYLYFNQNFNIICGSN